MHYSMLVALNDSPSSRAVVDFLTRFFVCKESTSVTLLNVFRRPSSGEMLMGHKFMENLPKKYMEFLHLAKDRLVEAGYPPDNVDVVQLDEPFDTVTDGLIEYFHRGSFDVVVVGRKKMSKAEEFVSGDVSVKVLRALDETAVLIVKCK